jgi:putative ABC transport system ATP-binding protein
MPIPSLERLAAPPITAPVAARATALRKTFGTDDATAVHALAGVDVAFAAGEFTAVMGPSGSGKSTLMHLMAALDTPTSGTVTIGDIDVTSLTDKQLTELRRDRIGFVFRALQPAAGADRGGEHRAPPRTGGPPSRSGLAGDRHRHRRTA